MVIATIFLMALSGTARAEIFTAYLTSAQEVPVNASTANGWARVTVNETAGTISWTVFFQGLGTNQTASHIHAPAAIGANIGIIIDLGTVGGTTGTITNSGSITPAQLAQIRAGLAYINVHSTGFGAGEIRGQLGKDRPLDFDGDGRTDLSVLRFPNILPPGVAPITWWNLNSFTPNTPYIYNPWGNANTDFPATGDWEGDGKEDIAIFRSPDPAGQAEFWAVQSSNAAVRYGAWGLTGDIPVQRDYDGDGITDFAVVRPSLVPSEPLTWYIRNSATGTVSIATFGLSGDGVNNFDTPIPGDYDGDGKFDIAVYRFNLSPVNNFIYRRSSDGVIVYRPFGNFNTDWILPGDYDGDGKTDLAVARTGLTSTSPLVWWIERSGSGVVTTQTFGRSNDRPTQGDYDGDIRTDLAIYRPGATATAQSVYWIQNSLDNSIRVVNWGLGADFSTNTFDTR